MFVFYDRRRKLLRLYFIFDTYLIRHYDIIANISLYIIGVVARHRKYTVALEFIEKIKQKIDKFLS